MVVDNSMEMLAMQLLWLVHGLGSRRDMQTVNHLPVLYPCINLCSFSGTELRWHGHLFLYGGIQDPLPEQFIRGLLVDALLGQPQIVPDAQVNSEK